MKMNARASAACNGTCLERRKICIVHIFAGKASVDSIEYFFDKRRKFILVVVGNDSDVVLGLYGSSEQLACTRALRNRCTTGTRGCPVSRGSNANMLVCFCKKIEFVAVCDDNGRRSCSSIDDGPAVVVVDAKGSAELRVR